MKCEDMIDDETYVRDALDDSALFDVWHTYVAEPWQSEFDEREHEILYSAWMNELSNEEKTPEEARLSERFNARRAEESAKRLGGSHFSYEVRLRAGRLYRLLSLGAPKIVIENDERYLICFLALWKYAKCE